MFIGSPERTGAISKSSLCVLILLSAFAGAGLAQAQDSTSDPFMEFNRNIYAFNKAFDDLLVKPVATTYDNVMPTFAKRGVSNFFSNLDDINVVINDVLQMKVDDALHDSGRLLINTTIGLGGLVDMASEFGLYKNHEDFGQTLGHWGVPAGPYLVLPFLGASSARDTFGLIPDQYLLNPVFQVDDKGSRFALYGLKTVDTRLFYAASESMISGDEYLFVRDAYLQRRTYLIADGEVYDEFDEF